MRDVRTNTRTVEKLALVVYRWAANSQDRLLVELLAPRFRALRRSGVLGTFWFDRFDARGPHLTLLTTVHPGDRQMLMEDLGEDLRYYLKKNPDIGNLGTEKLEEIHRGCGGKTLKTADRLPGLATADTFLFVDHSSNEYPWAFTRSPGPGGELWPKVEELCWWTVDQLSRAADSKRIRHGSAVRWIHCVDRAIEGGPLWKVAFWRFSAARLIHFLENERFEDSAFCLRALPPWIGESNQKSFSAAWDSFDRQDAPFPGVRALVRLAREEVDTSRFSELTLLREVVHWGLAQLGIPVRLRAVLLVFAWFAALAQEGT